MSAPVPSAPLSGLPVVVLDTETTGLDAGSARLLQVAALRVVGERIDATDRLESLIDPGQAIPPASTAIHGLRDEDVAGAPAADRVLEALAGFIAEGVIVGHTIGFDLEILRREAARAGVPWHRYRALDIRLLARVAAPHLAGYGLEEVCAWLDVRINGRHTALGDAVATAEAYARLVPLLRQAGVRTLAEAEAACRRANEREAVAAGDPSAAPPADTQPLDWGAAERIDSYPYRHRVREVMSTPPVRLPADTTLRGAVAVLTERRVSSVFVDTEDGSTGIVTERDVLRCLQDHGAGALDTRIGDICSKPLHTVGQDDFLYRAIGRMDRFGVRHLGVVDESGRYVGAVTTRTLLRHRTSTAMVLGDEIASGEDEAALAAAWAKVPVMARRLLDEGVDPGGIAAVISAEIRMLTRRAAELGEARMADAGDGAPPVPYCVLVLGSAGRGESLLSADQDNAIVFAQGDPGGLEDRWFARLGAHIADILDRVGVPYCDGGVMAREAPWRRSAAGWKSTIDDWIGRQRPQDLLNVDIFFDAMPVHGDRALGEKIWSYAYARGRGVAGFRCALSDTLAGWRSPLGMFGSVRTGANDRVDVKWGGLLPIFTAARVLSIKAGAVVRGSPERLRSAASAGFAAPNQIERLIEAHRVVLGALLAQQLDDIEHGIPPGPKVDPRRLAKTERSALKTALARIPEAVDLSREGRL